MDNKKLMPEVLIRVRFYLTEEGGRKHEIDTTYGEYHATLCIDGEYFDCRSWGNEPQVYKLGEWYNILIKFLSPELALPHFINGKLFTLWEGKTIAEGFVDKVLMESDQQV